MQFRRIRVDENPHCFPQDVKFCKIKVGTFNEVSQRNPGFKVHAQCRWDASEVISRMHFWDQTASLYMKQKAAIHKMAPKITTHRHIPSKMTGSFSTCKTCILRTTQKDNLKHTKITSQKYPKTLIFC
jgi:hypothetical protein